MHWEEVQALGNKIYGIKITTLKGNFSAKTLLLGFDTEYDSKTHKLLSIQLANDKDSVFYEASKDFEVNLEGKITVLTFRGLLRKFFKNQNTNIRHQNILLYTYWSIAELQHFILSDDIKINENPFTYTMDILVTDKQKNHNRISILDLFTWYQQGLSGLAKALLNKDKLDYDTTEITEKDLLNPKFREYAVYDAFLCFEIATLLRKRFWELFQIDITLTQTTARTSGAAFRKHYVKEPLIQDNTSVRRQALLSNWGGSSIAFNRGVYKNTFYYYDAISMYPSAAIELKYLPVGKDWFNVYDINDYKKIDGICKVRFKFKDNEKHPNLLVVPKRPFTRQIFPLEGTSHTTGKEIKAAFEKGADIELIYGYGYETGITAFSDYLQDLVTRKAEAKKAKNIVDTFIYKLMANSIIGKTKQSIYKSDINDIIESVRKWGKDSISPFPKRLVTGSIFMPEWNTIILGFARSVSLKAFEKTQAYVGTVDSVITIQDYGKTFNIDNIIYEKKFIGYETGILRAKGYYVLAEDPKDNHVAHHGFAGKPEDYITIVRKGQTEPYIKYKKARPIKLRSALRRDLSFGEFKPVELWYNTDYDNSRRLLNDNTTKPWLNIKEFINFEGKYRKNKKIIKTARQNMIQEFFKDYTTEKKK